MSAWLTVRSRQRGSYLHDSERNLERASLLLKSSTRLGSRTCLSEGLMLFAFAQLKLFVHIIIKSSRGYRVVSTAPQLYLVSTRVMRAFAVGSMHSTSSGSLQENCQLLRAIM